jgi:hypothetical protein
MKVGARMLVDCDAARYHPEDDARIVPRASSDVTRSVDDKANSDERARYWKALAH